MIGDSLNGLLIAAMVIYCRELDLSLLMSISVLISNIIVSVFFTGSTAITSIGRSWLFGGSDNNYKIFLDGFIIRVVYQLIR